MRKLLRNEGLLGGLPRRLQRGGINDSDDDDGGWASAGGAAAGDVLLEVDKARLEALYQQHLLEEDYLEKVSMLRYS